MIHLTIEVKSQELRKVFLLAILHALDQPGFTPVTRITVSPDFTNVSLAYQDTSDLIEAASNDFASLLKTRIKLLFVSDEEKDDFNFPLEKAREQKIYFDPAFQYCISPDVRSAR